MKKRIVILGILLSLAMILVSCGQPTQEIAPTQPSPTPVETQTPPSTETLTSTPEPQLTPSPPSTETPSPTETPEPSSVETFTPTEEGPDTTTIPILLVEWEQVEQLPPLGTNRFPTAEEWHHWQDIFDSQVRENLAKDPEFLPPGIGPIQHREASMALFDIVIDGEIVFWEVIDNTEVNPNLLFPGENYLARVRDQLRFIYSLNNGRPWTELTPPTDWFTEPSMVSAKRIYKGIRIVRSERQIHFYITLVGLTVWKTGIQQSDPPK